MRRIQRNGLHGIVQGVALAVLAAGCSQENRIALPSLTAPAPGVIWGSGPVGGWSVRDLAGSSWSGTTSATGLGSSGTLEADFTFDGVNVTALLEWTSNDGGGSYSGTVSGTVSDMTISTASGPCSYTAQGSLSEDDTVFSGTYTATGPGVCPQKTGTFRLEREEGQCMECVEACVGPWSYDGDNPVQLENSSDATELAFVLAHVTPNELDGPTKLEPGGATWTADGSYPVVLVKAGRGYRVYTNVTSGDVLEGPADKDISHVSLFVCSEEE